MDKLNQAAAGPPLAGDIRDDFIPANRWRDPEIPRLERERLWPRIWHIACREEEIPAVGDYATYEILDESIIVVRVAEDQIKAYYNACQHRGRRLVEPGRGHVSSFVCRFHGWSYGLDGANRRVLHEEAWAHCPDFRKADLALKEPRCDRWAGWVWVNMDPDAEPLSAWLGPVVELARPFALEELRVAWRQTIIAPVNWKVVIEAFHEGYHSGATHDSWVDYYDMHSPTQVFGNHAGFSGVFEKMPRMRREGGEWTEATSLADMLYYQSKELHDCLHALVSTPLLRAMDRLRQEFPPGADETLLFPRLLELQREELEATGAKWPEGLTMEAIGAAGTNIHIIPNTIFLPSADAVLWYRMRPHPKDADRCVFDIWSLNRYPQGAAVQPIEHFAESFEAARGRNAFLEQDFSNMLAVNQGMRSRGWAGARTSPAEEATVTHFHRMLDRFYAMPPL